MPDANNRSEGRSNVFLAAVLAVGSLTMPVRIRNLSPKGALVEGHALPPVGAKIRLVRGELEASGDIAWQGAGQGGINFSGSIDVDGWVRKTGHGGQQRVDSAISALRRPGAGRVVAPVAETHSLATISAALDQVCEDLAASSEMSVELGEKLIRLDAIAQALRDLAKGKA